MSPWVSTVRLSSTRCSLLTQLNVSSLLTDLLSQESKWNQREGNTHMLKHTCAVTSIQRVFCPWFMHTHQTVISERQTCHARFKVRSLTRGWFTRRNMNSSLHSGWFNEKNSLLKQIHCVQPPAQCPNSTLIMVALSPTRMFTYRPTNIHAHKCTHALTHAQGRLTNW